LAVSEANPNVPRHNRAMDLKTLIATSLGGLLLAANNEPQLPSGWSRQSTLGADRVCAAGRDASPFDRDRRVLTIECGRATDGYMTVMQTIAADDYRGRRVRFVARMKADKVRGWAGLWMRVMSADQRVLAFDDMSTRPVRDNADWRDYQVILDVEPAAAAISFGVRLSEGSGQVWVDAFRFEEVAPDDPSISINLRPLLPSKPQNLELE
jgi:hypothetical protein